MNHDVPSGYYLDSEGNLQKDRRRGARRKKRIIINHNDRRTEGRRKSDMDFDERETREAIADALEDMARGDGDD